MQAGLNPATRHTQQLSQLLAEPKDCQNPKKLTQQIPSAIKTEKTNQHIDTAPTPTHWRRLPEVKSSVMKLIDMVFESSHES